MKTACFPEFSLSTHLLGILQHEAATYLLLISSGRDNQLIFYGTNFMQGEMSAQAQALENVEMLADLISVSLQVDDNGSATFSLSGDFISK